LSCPVEKRVSRSTGFTYSDSRASGYGGFVPSYHIRSMSLRRLDRGGRRDVADGPGRRCRSWTSARNGPRLGMGLGPEWTSARNGPRLGMDLGSEWTSARNGPRLGMDLGSEWTSARNGPRPGMDLGPEWTSATSCEQHGWRTSTRCARSDRLRSDDRRVGRRVFVHLRPG
jgi:hypothetical protein